MPNIVGRTLQMLFMLAVVASFGYGGVQAMSVSGADGCLDQPPDFLGECTGPDDPDCHTRCVEEEGGFLGQCFEDKDEIWCCICAL